MEQDDLMLFIIIAFESLDVPYMITGSQASAYYGEPRFTIDIDIVADLREEHVEDFVRLFSKDEFYCDQQMIKEEVKRRGQFNIIHSISSLKVDIILTKSTPFSKTEFSRKTKRAIIHNRNAFFATPEDVIIKKLDYYKQGGSEKHLRDVSGILKMSEDIDHSYIAKWADMLGIREIWDAVLDRLKN